MGSISLCIGLEGSLHGCRSFCMTEELYREIFKVFIKSLYEWKDGAMCVHFSGIILDWLKSRHGEYIDLVVELIRNKRLEILGGGYYEPLFSMVPPSCTDGQLENLNDFVSRNLGKRPHGCWLTGSAWDSSIVSSLQSCGFSYVFLDSALTFSCAPDGYDQLKPVITEYNGKPLTVFPVQKVWADGAIPEPEAFVQYLLENADNSGERIVTVFIPALMVPVFFQKTGKNASWMNRLLAALQEHNDVISLQTPASYLKQNTSFSRLYIPQGASPSVFDEFYQKTDSPIDGRLRALTSIKNWLLMYPEASDIYYKMIFVNALVSQLRGDKARKRSARDKVLLAQNCRCFWNVGCPGVSRRDIRDFAYKALLKAENITRDLRDFTASLSGFDYDADGLKEYVCLYPDSGVYIHTKGGIVFEFDHFPSCCNYVNTGSRRADNSIDSYRHKMFVDHLVPAESIAEIRHSGAPINSVFPSEVYKEITCDRTKLELTLKSVGNYHSESFNQPVSLKKKFIFRKEGIQVQYILKNESPFPLSAVFMVELNLSLPGNLPSEQNVKIFAGNTMHTDVYTSSAYEDAEWVRIEDLMNNVNFQVESNENGVVIFRYLTTVSDAGRACCEEYEASQLFFAWNVDIAPNYEMEKTIFFKVAQSVLLENIVP